MAAGEAFTLRGVPVSGEGGDAEQARQAALLAGQAEAFQRLARRLVADEDLPGVPALSPAEVEPLIVGTEVEQESIKKTSYSARLTYRFDAEAVRRLFGGLGLRFTEAVSRPLVVLPVLGEGEGARLWADPNPWRVAWANHWAPGGLVPLLVPLGELQDLAAADAPEALAGDAAALAEIAGLYGAGGTLVAQASLGGDPAAGEAHIGMKRSKIAGRQKTGHLEGARPSGQRARHAEAIQETEAFVAHDPPYSILDQTYPRMRRINPTLKRRLPSGGTEVAGGSSGAAGTGGTVCGSPGAGGTLASLTAAMKPRRVSRLSSRVRARSSSAMTERVASRSPMSR